ncbi:MAG: sulfotransferase family 2 domain-containing protein [Sphingomonadaceae bacterium]
MIISDQHRFAFVHIPKCAGTSVRKALRPIDETIGQFDQIGSHADMGTIHYGHITLADLARYFPEHYAKVRAFRSMAIVRHPVDRFFSAVFQRLREFKGYDQSQISQTVIETEANALARHLTASTDRLDLAHVHFNRQSDYVFNDGERVVAEVFALDRLEDASAFIEACTGVRLETEARENRTAALRFGSLQPIVRALRAPYGALVPLEARNRIRNYLVKTGVYGDVETRNFAKPGSYLDGFLADYYRDDFSLYAAATAR